MSEDHEKQLDAILHDVFDHRMTTAGARPRVHQVVEAEVAQRVDEAVRIFSEQSEALKKPEIRIGGCI